MWVLRPDDLDDLRAGAMILGSGGGGEPYWFCALARHTMGGRPITVYEARDLPGRCEVITTGLVGSITDFNERPASGTEFARAVQRLIAHRPSGTPTFVSSYESAGVNAFAAITVAALTGLPLVDIDPMGRGLSWLNQTTYDAAGVMASPFVITDPAGHTVLAEGIDGHDAERFLRSIMVLMGGWCAFAGYRVSGHDAAALGARDTLRRGLRLGRVLRAAQPGAAARDLSTSLRATHLGTGRVAQISWRHTPEGDFGSVVIKGAVPTNPECFRVEARNEFLAVIRNGEPIATTPDIICLLSQPDGHPLLAERLTTGIEVDLVALPAPGPWPHEPFHARVSPAAFHLDLGERP